MTTPEATMAEIEALVAAINNSRGHWTSDDWAGNYGAAQNTVPNLTDRQRDLIIAALSRAAPTPAEAPIDNWHDKPIEELSREELVGALTWSVNRQRELLRELSELRPAPAAEVTGLETIQTLLDLLNPLHGSLDRQTYDEKVRAGFDAPPDAEYAVNVTAQQERDLTQAVMILEDRKRQAAVVAAAEVTGELCTYGPPTERKRHWILKFEDSEMGDMHFDCEAEALATFHRCTSNWNCTLLATVGTPSPDAGRVSEGWQDRIVKWHLENGGSNKRLAGHALRLLHEAIELCVAAGATEIELRRRIETEIAKERERGEFEKPVEFSNVREELADVFALAAVLAHYTGNADVAKDVHAKIDTLLDRQWEADADGVLWRPGRAMLAASPDHDEVKGAREGWQQAIERCKKVILDYPLSETAQAHSNQAVVANVCDNLFGELRRLAASPPHDEVKS